MSAASPIELLDDNSKDEDDNDTDDGDKKEHSTCIQREKKAAAIQTYLEFSSSQDISSAVLILEASNYDVQRALAQRFDSTAIRVEAKQPEDVGKGDQKHAALQIIHKRDSLEEEKGDAEEPLVSITWYNCMARSSDRFVDPDFPPNQSSLDGRKQNSQPLEQAINCTCGLPATPKTVQSDGPNYGRFYLCCGMARQRGVAREKQCKFFQWDDRHGSKGAASGGYATRYALMAWEFFGEKHSLVQSSGFSPSAVRQGAVGNCWFLSALAVVAEKPYLVNQLLPHKKLNDKGCYQVNLCLDGKWTPIIVDSHLPVVFGGRIIDPLRGGTSSSTSDSTVHPAFCAVPNGQLWPALIEKAYAKAHGCYQQLSGGFIQEGFQDMTGAPTETLVLDSNIWDFEDVWARLLSFHEAGFLLGVATSQGGDGLVGGHAYSVLEVLEINDMLVGEQQSMKDFMKRSPVKKKQRTTVRLVRIRNPWGQKEWKGEWSANSDQWTKALRKRLGEKSYAKGDGTFFMSYQDMIQRFHHMDVAKCRKCWNHTSCDGCFLSGTGDPLKSSRHYFRMTVKVKTFAFISIIQPKKRANTTSTFWYSDPSMIILKRNGASTDWECEKIEICGITRSSTLEVFLEPSWEYCVVPFSFESAKDAPFRVSSYSAMPVEIGQVNIKQLVGSAPVQHLHRHLLKDERKLQYVVASKGVLVCIHGKRCLYFMVINASHDHILSLRLCVKLQKGLSLSHGTSGEVIDVAPRSQKIVMVVSSDGTLSSAVSIGFTYASDTVTTTASTRRPSSGYALGASIELSMTGDLMASSVDPGCDRNKGGDTIETYQWLAQIGSAP